MAAYVGTAVGRQWVLHNSQYTGICMEQLRKITKQPSWWCGWYFTWQFPDISHVTTLLYWSICTVSTLFSDQSLSCAVWHCYQLKALINAVPLKSLRTWNTAAQSCNCNKLYYVYQSHGTRQKILTELHDAVIGRLEDSGSLFNVADESAN
jgi:hypothetical protein